MNNLEFIILDNCNLVCIDWGGMDNKALAISGIPEEFDIAVTIIPLEPESFSGQIYQ